MRARATAVEHGLAGGTAVAEKCFLADAAVMDNMVQLQRKKKGEKKGTSRTGNVDGRRGKEEEDVQRWWGMLWADNAGIVTGSPGGLERMMTVIVTACSAFGLTVSEAKTEILCLQTKGGKKVSLTINAAGQVYKQKIEFVYKTKKYAAFLCTRSSPLWTSLPARRNSYVRLGLQYLSYSCAASIVAQWAYDHPRE